MAIRIAINGRSFGSPQRTGIGRYAYNLVQSLSALDGGNEYFIYLAKNLFDFKRHIPSLSAPNFHSKIDYFKRGAEKMIPGLDIYHSPSMDFINIERAKTIVTVHDLIYQSYPQGHTDETIRTTEKQLKDVVKKANRIICCSQSTMDDLRKYFPEVQGRARLIYQGVDKNIFYPIPAEERARVQGTLIRHGVEGPFILFVGTIERRKNLHHLLKAFAMLKEQKKFSGPLVVIGMPGWKTENIGGLIEELNLERDIRFLGFLANDELRHFYNAAEVFVFPSFYEGFGFPLVEAFSCGTAVVTSNVSSCPELAADAALTVDPRNPEAMAQAIVKIISQPDFKQELRQKAVRRAADFSFTETARRTLEIYKEVYALGPK